MGYNDIRSTVNTDCYAYANGNSGCGVRFPTAESYGSSFNNIGGGWYAMERSNTQISVWFWPRNGAVPSDVRSGASSVNPANWVRASARVIYIKVHESYIQGIPAALFPYMSCDIDAYFAAQNIVINLTFCEECIFYL